MKYVEVKKNIVYVKLTVYYTVSFTCNIYFLNSTNLYLINLRVTNFRVSFAVECICLDHIAQLAMCKVGLQVGSDTFSSHVTLNY